MNLWAKAVTRLNQIHNMRKHNTKLADFNIHNLRRNTMLNNNLDLKSAPELKTLKCF